MVYDPVTRRMILFGGGYAPSPGAATVVVDDTWVYDPVANTWTELKPAGAVPPARHGHAAAYDSGIGRLIVFGGFNSTAMLNDTWAYDPVGNAWTDLRPSGDLPSARVLTSMAYDQSKSRMTLFGGLDASRIPFGDTWEYDAGTNRWTEIVSEGDAPAAREAPSLVYCVSAMRTVMFGGGNERGVTLNDTWVYAR